jgi:hypothetical protein
LQGVRSTDVNNGQTTSLNRSFRAVDLRKAPSHMHLNTALDCRAWLRSTPRRPLGLGARALAAESYQRVLPGASLILDERKKLTQTTVGVGKDADCE